MRSTIGEAGFLLRERVLHCPKRLDWCLLRKRHGLTMIALFARRVPMVCFARCEM
jgi:hypothetical protein